MYTKKFYFYAKNHLPFSVLRCDQYPLRCEPKRVKNGDFLHVFTCESTGIDRITNRRTGGDFLPRNITFLYTTLSCEINIQILNCAGSFDGMSWRTAARTAGKPWSTLVVSGLPSLVRTRLRGRYRACLKYCWLCFTQLGPYSLSSRRPESYMSQGCGPYRTQMYQPAHFGEMCIVAQKKGAKCHVYTMYIQCTY